MTPRPSACWKPLTSFTFGVASLRESLREEMDLADPGEAADFIRGAAEDVL